MVYSDQLQKDLAALKSIQRPTVETKPSEISLNSEPSLQSFHNSSAKLTRDTSKNVKSPSSTTQPSTSISFVNTRKVVEHSDPNSIRMSPKAGADKLRKPRSASPMTATVNRGMRGLSPAVGAMSPSTIRRAPGSATSTRARKNPSELESAKQEVEVLKRKVWELNAKAQEDDDRIQSLENEREELNEQLSHSLSTIASLEESCTEYRVEITNQNEICSNLRREVDSKNNEIANITLQFMQAKEEVEKTKDDASRRIAAITEAANQRMGEFEDHIKSMQQNETKLNETISDLRQGIAKLEETLLRKDSEYRSILREGEIQRATLHNRIQEMKGNIRVYARLRPLIPHDKEYKRTQEIEYYEFPDKVDHRALRLTFPNGDKDYSFEFDKVFEPDATQSYVFEEIAQLVQSALDGYKVCIFVYGQTGSGKTYTMEGEPGEKLGMIPRAVEHIFHQSQAKKSTGWEYSLRATFVEIYNDTIHDLLNPQDFKGPNSPPPLKHEIRIVDNDTIITNVEELTVEDANTVHQLLDISQANRRCESTLMNDRASRSHSVFTLKIRGVNEGTAQVQEGVLNLIDLAGSERVGKSGVEGDRFRETAYINKSLTCLGDVISALAKGDSHVPFRNSKLTHMLQPYMGGESKTLMFVNISPAESHINESLCSLRFAAKVNACEIGLALRRVQSVSTISQLKK